MTQSGTCSTSPVPARAMRGEYLASVGGNRALITNELDREW
jgi:hypothetical protein